MENVERTYRLSPSWWIGNILIGLLLLSLSFFTLLVNAQDLFSGQSSVSDYLGVALLLFIMAPFGVLLFAFPFITKIVVNPHGLEYHTTTYILIANWVDLVNVGHIKKENVGKTLVVVPRGGKVILRKWVQPLRFFLKHDPKHIEILVAQFHTANGQSLETDILVNVAQRGELPLELESL